MQIGDKMKNELKEIEILISKGFTESEAKEILYYKSKNAAYEKLSPEEKVNYILNSEDFAKYGDIYMKITELTKEQLIEQIIESCN